MARIERKAKTESQLDKGRRYGRALPAFDREAAGLTDQIVLSGKDCNLSFAGSIEAQIHRLSDSGVWGVQRRELALRIARTQGNEHLQRVVTSLRDAGDTAVRAAPGKDTIARDVVSDAEQRTGSPRAWPSLPVKGQWRRHRSSR